MRTAAIVQARMRSNRLPGKVLEDVNGQSVLQRVLSRCKGIEGVDTVVCAVPDGADNEPVATAAGACGVFVVRGSETDVLDRYICAARAVSADVVLRVTSDCPLIDPMVCGRVIELRSQAQADYAANNLMRTFPHGLDCEAFKVEALVEAGEAARDAYDREHVTPWLRRAPHLVRANLSSPDSALAAHRWTLDYPEDLAFIRAVFAHLPAGSAGTMLDVCEVLRAHPDICRINAARAEALPA